MQAVTIEEKQEQAVVTSTPNESHPQPPQSLPFDKLLCSVTPTEDLSEEVTAHNDAVTDLKQRYAKKCGLATVDYRSVTVANLLKQRDSQRQARLTCLQDAMTLGAQVEELNEKLQVAWSKQANSIRDSEDKVRKVADKGYRNLGHGGDYAAEAKLKGLINSHPKVVEVREQIAEAMRMSQLCFAKNRETATAATTFHSEMRKLCDGLRQG